MPVQANISGVVAFAGGGAHTVVVKTERPVWAWGRNNDGQLGNGLDADSDVPVLSTIEGVSDVAAGYSHTVALKTTGALYACGDNSLGQLGNGTNTDSNVPVQANISGVAVIAAGGDHTVALKSLFYDVPPWFWAHEYIVGIYEAGIATGYADGTYRPSENVTRAAMAAFIIRALYGETFSYTLTPYFTDVPNTSQFFKYIQKMRDEGITTGCTATEYCPSNNVNRAAMAAFIARAFLGME